MNVVGRNLNSLRCKINLQMSDYQSELTLCPKKVMTKYKYLVIHVTVLIFRYNMCIRKSRISQSHLVWSVYSLCTLFDVRPVAYPASLLRCQKMIVNDEVKTFFQDRDICQNRCQDTRRAKTFRIRLRQDETETSFKCLRHETLQDTASKR